LRAVGKRRGDGERAFHAARQLPEARIAFCFKLKTCQQGQGARRARG
jgi:hypothetical protein